jgi:hypothetical protein
MSARAFGQDEGTDYSNPAEVEAEKVRSSQPAPSVKRANHAAGARLNQAHVGQHGRPHASGRRYLTEPVHWFRVVGHVTTERCTTESGWDNFWRNGNRTTQDIVDHGWSGRRETCRSSEGDDREWHTWDADGRVTILRSEDDEGTKYYLCKSQDYPDDPAVWIAEEKLSISPVYYYLEPEISDYP